MKTFFPQKTTGIFIWNKSNTYQQDVNYRLPKKKKNPIQYLSEILKDIDHRIGDDV